MLDTSAPELHKISEGTRGIVVEPNHKNQFRPGTVIVSFTSTGVGQWVPRSWWIPIKYLDYGNILDKLARI